MQNGGFVGGLYRISEWIMRFAYLNLLWIFFTIVGIIIIGVAPATTAMFNVVRKWIRNGSDIPVFRTFWSAYRSEFIRANLFGLILFFLGYILYIDFIFITNLDGMLGLLLNVALLLVLMFYVIVILYIFPVFVHYQLKIFQYFKYAIVIGISFPLRTIMMAVSVFVIYQLSIHIQGLILFFSVSSLSFVITWITYGAFLKIEEKQQNGKNKEQVSTIGYDNLKKSDR
ncbi:YesL family protein [Bacillaceae bacterium S4-13-58]